MDVESCEVEINSKGPFGALLPGGIDIVCYK